MGKLSGKRAIIAGGNKGIGEAIARLFAEEGAELIIGGRDEQATHAVAESIGGSAQAVRLDVTQRASWESLIAKARQRWGGLDVLVNCAGAFRGGSIEDTDDESWHLHMQTNLYGVFLGCQTVLPLMKDSGGAGAIINIGSAMTKRPTGGLLAYVASKSGMVGMSQSIALHCAQNGYKIRVNVIHPGGIETQMLTAALDDSGMPRDEAYEMWRQFHPMGRIGRPEEVAEAAVWLASDAASFTTGAELNVDGGAVIKP